jgi:glycosyltransferase involved in cell wall biosynthesis
MEQLNGDDFPALRRVAILIPCFNEELSIARAVSDFREALPTATIFVYDNNSTDRTVEVAARAGAVVRHEPRQGKGHVVRRMFSDIDAEIYVLVDGDATYHAPSVRPMIIKLIQEQLDMVVGARFDQDQAAYRPWHRFGNRLLTGFVRRIFGAKLSDMLSGYRVFSRRFVKSFPGLSGGFEIETELTIHALELELPIADILTPYYSRMEGAVSKLKTWRDGSRILWTIARLYRSERPLAFFSIIAAVFASSSIVLAVPIVITFLEQGIVPRLPTAVLSTGLMILSFLCMASGLVLDTVTRGRREMKLLFYLAQKQAVTVSDPKD